MNITEEVRVAEPQPKRWGLKAAVVATIVVTGSLSWMAISKNSGAEPTSAELIGSSSMPAPAEFRTTADSDVDIYTLTIRPGATGGWHSHLGPVLVTVSQGTATIYQADGAACTRNAYKAGQAVVEQAGVIHTTRNEGKRDLIIHGVSMRPKGADMAIPQPRPADCHH